MRPLDMAAAPKAVDARGVGFAEVTAETRGPAADWRASIAARIACACEKTPLPMGPESPREKLGAAIAVVTGCSEQWRRPAGRTGVIVESLCGVRARR
jgi:hypothetical protein